MAGLEAFIFKVIDQRSRLILDLEYFYIEQHLTDLNQSWYKVRIWKCLEPIYILKSSVKGQCQNGLLDNFQLGKPCEHSTLNVSSHILTKLGIRIVGYRKILKPIYFQVHRAMIKEEG